MPMFETIANLLARLAAWALFAIGLMLGYEVAARYFFIAPTIWAEELSRLIMVWAVFIGASTLVRDDGHIRVTLLTDVLPPAGQKLARFLALAFLGIFAAIISWNGIPTVLNSFERGRTTGSMMDIPSWWMQAAIPVGFALIALQALIQILLHVRRPADSGDANRPLGGGLS